MVPAGDPGQETGSISSPWQRWKPQLRLRLMSEESATMNPLISFEHVSRHIP